MTSNDRAFSGSIPEIYDRHMVPLIFQPYADDLARRVAALQPASVLETACGTGVVTRACAARLGPQARIVATDLNPPMLAQAARRLGADPRVAWQPADALALPFDDAGFDAVVCQFGAMFFPDRVRGFAEARRVLRPGGRFLFNVWDRIETSDFADLVTRAAGDIFADDPPRFLARTPHGYNDEARIRADVAAAGFTDIAIEGVDALSRAATPREAAAAFCQGTPLRGEIEARDARRIDDVIRHATDLIAARFGQGPIEGRMRALVISAG